MECSSYKKLVEDFNKYFSSTISKISSDITDKLQPNNFEYTEPLPIIPYTHNASLGTFKLLDIQSITEINKAAATKSCALDPIPTTPLKANLREITPTISCIINKSLQSGRISSFLKPANIRPLLRNILEPIKTTIDQSQTSHFYQSYSYVQFQIH